MKKILLSTVALILSAAVLSAEVVLGTGAVSQSTAGNENTTLGGAGAFGAGIAFSGSSYQGTNTSTGFGVGGTIGILSGATTGTETTGSSETLNTAGALGLAGGFSGVGASGAGQSTSFAFGGLGVFQP